MSGGRDSVRDGSFVCASRLTWARRAIAPWLGVGLVLGLVPVADAATFMVNDTADAVDAAVDGVCAAASGKCTLRAALQEANAMPDADEIDLPPGTYTLTVDGPDDDVAATGDLDILNDVTISHAGAGVAVVSGNNMVRVFDVFAPAHVTLGGLTIQNGNGLTDPGGGIRNRGTLALAEVTIVDNTAAEGGGIANLDSGTASLINVTLTRNNAINAGGGLSNSEHTGTLNLTAVTVSGNAAPVGAGIDSLGMAHLRNVLVAGNLAGGNCHGAVISLGHNLEDGFTCAFDAAGDLSNTAPQLGILQNNGGSTPTLALLPGSPAIDAGDNTDCPATDQRGQARPADGDHDGVALCDIGAYEFPGPMPPTPSPTPTAGDTPPASATPTETPSTTPERPRIELGTATGSPGELVSFTATLRTVGSTVGSSNNDIRFDSINAPIAALPNGRPDCTVNPSINKQPSFSFLPALPVQCTGAQCTMVRAAVFDLSEPILPIPDGTALYSCHVAISPDAALGDYQLAISRVVLSDPLGNPVPNAVGTDGKVVVVAPATLTPTATVTATPTQTATPTPTPRCVGDCQQDGQVTVDEILTMLSIGLGNADLTTCRAADGNHDGIVTVDEILTAVNNALNGCPLAVA